MDTAELKALLEAAIRELASVAAQFPDGDEHFLPAREEIHRAHSALEFAVSCGKPSSKPAIAGGGAGFPSEVVREAWSMRAGALRAHHVAQAQLRTLQDEHTELINQLHHLTQVQSCEAEQHRSAAVSASRGEEDLLEECQRLEVQVKAMQAEVVAKSKRLATCKSLGHNMSMNQRRLQRKHEDTLAENAVSREILALQQSTAAHLRKALEHQEELGESLASAHRDCAEKCRTLHEEWSEQQADYERKMSVFERRLETLKEQYIQRWNFTEKHTREKLEEQVQISVTARSDFLRQFSEIDKNCEHESQARQEQIHRLHRMVIEAREQAVSHMEEKLEEQRKDLHAKVDIERDRCHTLRQKQLVHAETFAREMQHYKSHIGKVRDNYRSRALPQLNTPRAEMSTPR